MPLLASDLLIFGLPRIEPGNGYKVFFQAQLPHHHQSPARRLPRLTLVFWRFGADARIVALFIAVEARDLIDVSVLGLLLLLLLDLHCVGDTSRGLIFVSPFLVPFLFLLLAGLLGGLAGLGLGRSRPYFFYFRLLRVGVFYSLVLHLCGGAVGRAVTSGTADIRVSDHNARSQARFGLRVDCPLYHLFKVHRFPILLLHLDLDRRVETFSEVADHG